MGNKREIFVMKQSNFKRWEVILLVDMYYNIVNNDLDPKEESKKLSKYLRESNREEAINNPSYRNYQGIMMKYQNICAITSGKGLKNHSKLDSEIVEYFIKDNEKFKQELQEIKNV